MRLDNFVCDDEIFFESKENTILKTVTNMADTMCFIRIAGKPSMKIDFQTKTVTQLQSAGYFYDLATVKLKNYPNDLLLVAEG